MTRKKKFYFEDPDGDCLDKLYCHPNFINHFKSKFYYDCVDDFSPFGNDDGDDMLFELEELYQEYPTRKKMLKLVWQVIDSNGGYDFNAEKCSKITDIKTLREIHKKNEDFLMYLNNSVISAAYGQIKITGDIEPELKEVGLMALERQRTIISKSKSKYANEYRKVLTKMHKDLNSFK